MLERTLSEIAAADTSASLEAVRVAVLGKSGTLTGYLRSMGLVPAEERASVGKAVNAARGDVEEALAARKAALDAVELEAAMGAAAVDVTLPGRAQQVGTRHLINCIIDEVSDIFLGLGYKGVEGEEIETEYYNFTALNAPADHPRRSMQDTFYVHDLSGDTSRVRGESYVLLRTQTSGVQVHVMEDWDLPIYMIAPGKVYRPGGTEEGSFLLAREERRTLWQSQRSWRRCASAPWPKSPRRTRRRRSRPCAWRCWASPAR